MSPWFYKGQQINNIEDLGGEGLFGFIYIITNTNNGKIYIGRKIFFNTNTIKLGKRELEKLDDKRASKKKKVVKESDWKKYWGSNKELLKEYKESPDSFCREIIHLCANKKQMTYYELYFQIKYDVLHKDSYNDNISGKYFRKDI